MTYKYGYYVSGAGYPYNIIYEIIENEFGQDWVIQGKIIKVVKNGEYLQNISKYMELYEIGKIEKFNGPKYSYHNSLFYETWEDLVKDHFDTLLK